MTTPTPTSHVRPILTWDQMGRLAQAAGRTLVGMIRILNLGQPRPSPDQVEFVPWSESCQGFCQNDWSKLRTRGRASAR